MVIYVENQEAFDSLVKRVKKNARSDIRIYSFLNGNKTPNFTNHLELIEHEDRKYLVKASKLFSEFFYNAKSVSDAIKGKEPFFSWNTDRCLHESDALDELIAMDICVPERVHTNEKGVIVLKYYKGVETKSLIRDNLIFPYVLADLTTELGKIHKIGLHGESSTNNTFVCRQKAYWADFERFSKKVNDAGRARELAEFINSASRHAYKPIKEVARIAYESYPDSHVIDLTRKAV